MAAARLVDRCSRRTHAHVGPSTHAKLTNGVRVVRGRKEIENVAKNLYEARIKFLKMAVSNEFWFLGPKTPQSQEH